MSTETVEQKLDRLLKLRDKRQVLVRKLMDTSRRTGERGWKEVDGVDEEIGELYKELARAAEESAREEKNDRP